jgi:DivIVA domain-containing protein
METSDLDLPLLPSAEQIRRREFASVRRGYDPQQVRDYLTQVAAQVETLEKDLREGGDEDVLPAGPTGIQALADIDGNESPDEASDDPYQRVARRFAVVFETADTEAEEILSHARDEATRVLTDARSEADRIRVDAQARAEEARQEGREALERAKREAEETMGDLQIRRANLAEQLDGMRSTLLAVADDLLMEPADGVAESVDMDASEPVEAAVIEGDADQEPEPVKVVAEDDEDWLFEGGLDIPELELTDPEQDEGARG